MSFTANATGCEYTHTLSISEMPSHRHGQNVSANNGGSSIRLDYTSDGHGNVYEQETSNTGGGDSHKNIQPYIVVYFWRRTN